MNCKRIRINLFPIWTYVIVMDGLTISTFLYVFLSFLLGSDLIYKWLCTYMYHCLRVVEFVYLLNKVQLVLFHFLEVTVHSSLTTGAVFNSVHRLSFAKLFVLTCIQITSDITYLNKPTLKPNTDKHCDITWSIQNNAQSMCRIKCTLINGCTAYDDFKVNYMPANQGL